MRIGDYFGAEFGHDIRPVEIKSDLSEPLGFALTAKHSTGLIESVKRSIKLRLNVHHALQQRLLREIKNSQRLAIAAIIVIAK